MDGATLFTLERFKMKTIAVLHKLGLFFKKHPVQEVEEELKTLGYSTVYPVDEDDLIRLLELNPRISGVIFDWDTYSLDVCQRVNTVNEKLPLYAFANEHSALDINLSDLSLNIYFFEYCFSSAADIARKIHQATEDYKNSILPPLTRALFNYVKEGKLITELNRYRLMNIKELTTIISRINNIIFFS